jgi:multiple sugar transport system ATP-binding protein
MASISIRNLVKSYGNFPVIHDLNLEIADREFVVFVGPSGCGKSTLLRIIAGLEPITSGELYIGANKVTGVPAAQRDIAMVFQDYALYPHMRVRENMSFALELRGTPKAEIEQRVQRAAAMLHIEPYLDRKPKELSGGQRQRVAMGRAIVRNPKAFLFDEPLSNLDAKLRGQVRAEIKALSQQLKTTMVFVTHDQVEAMTMADRIVVLQSGTVQQYDTPEAVYERPSNQFVAGFIGSPTMNFFPVELRGELALLSDGTPMALDAESQTRLHKVGKAVLGVRPEHFVVAPGSPGRAAITVKLVEPLGSDTLIHFDLAGASAIARVDPALRPKVGDHLTLSPTPGKTHLFDSNSGQVLT